MTKKYAERTKGSVRDKVASIRFTNQEFFYLEILALKENLSTSAYLSQLVHNNFKTKQKKILKEYNYNDNNYFNFDYSSKGLCLLKKYSISEDLYGEDQKIMKFILRTKNCLTKNKGKTVIDPDYVSENYKQIRQITLGKDQTSNLPKNESHYNLTITKTLEKECWDNIEIKGW
jgi:hypothetical protein